jgi:hypothetical protein
LSAPGVARVRRENEPELHRFLQRKPYENVYLDWLIEYDRSPATRQRLFYAHDKDGAVTGVAHFGRQVVIAAQTPEAVHGFANAAYAYRHERMIVGEHDVTRAFWDAVKSWHAPPRLVRERQPLYVLSAGDWKLLPHGAVETRLARVEETDLVTQNSAAMIEHELGYDPRRATAGFRWNVQRMIERGMWWVGLRDGVPAFFCHLGPYNGRTVQLQGVWTTPEARGSGVATRAINQICGVLFNDFPTVSLYVNDFNHAAVALYRTLRFHEEGALTTYLF